MYIRRREKDEHRTLSSHLSPKSLTVGKYYFSIFKMMLAASILLLAATFVNSQRRDPYYDESPKPYAFNYNAVLDDNRFGTGQISRQETADGTGRVQGSYSLVNAEGHTRVVDYVADHDGFRAHVRTNEPGTDNQNPADVIMESSSPLANRNSQYSQGGAGRRPIVAAASDAREIVSVEPIPVNVLATGRHPAAYRRHF